MSRQLSPDSIDPFILAHAARLWTIASVMIAGTGLVAVLATAFIAGWAVALMPLMIFLLAAAAAFWQRRRLLTGKSVPEAVAARYHRTIPCEGIRLSIWLLAILAFLFWGLSGGWSLAWLVFLAAGLLEWLLDHFFGRRCT